MKEVQKFTLVPQDETQTLKETPILPTKNQLDEDSILLCIPKSRQYKAKALLNYIQHIPNMTWNDKGEVILDNEVISGSHISDVVKRCIFEYKDFCPVGLKPFYCFLLNNNVPKGLIVPIEQEGHGLFPPPGIPVKYKRKTISWITL